MNRKRIIIFILSAYLTTYTLHAAMRSRPSSPTIATSSNIAAGSEKATIEEIKTLLRQRKMPPQTFKQWVDNHAPVLSASSQVPLQELGKTLQMIRDGNFSEIHGSKVLSITETAVKVYDPTFYVSVLWIPGLLAKGAFWYLST